MTWPTLILLPLFILPFFDQTLQELPFVYFLAAGFLLLPVVFIYLKNAAAGPNKIISWLFLGLIAQIFISIIFSYSVAIPHTVIGLMFLASAYGWYLLGSSATPEMKKILPLLVLSTSVILSVISYLIILKILPAPASSVNLLTWTFGHHRLAGYLLFSLPVTIWAINQDWRWRKPAILGLILILPIFLVSGGRAAYLGALLSLGYLLKRNILGKRQGYSLMVVIGLVVLFFLSLPIFYRLWPETPVFRLVSSLQSAKGILIKPLSADSRFDYWSQAIRGVIYDPLGQGLETFRFQALFFRRPGESVSGYVHNQYLKMFAETGIIGGGLFLALIIMVLKLSHRAAAETGDQLTAALTAGLIASATAAVFDFDWQFPSIFLMFWLVAGAGGAKGESLTEIRTKKWPAAALAIPAIYGILVLSVVKLQPATTKYWNKGGEEAFSLSASRLSRLHPQLEEDIFETAKKKMAVAEFETFIKHQFPLYQYDNRMLAKVWEWQKYFGSKQDALVTAAVMADNDPLGEQTQQNLQEAAAAANP